MPHTPRKEPRQSRAKTTNAAILEGAARLLEAGDPAPTTNRIAARAGVSIGSLYQYFPNKQAIFAALIAREWDLLEARIRQDTQDAPDPRTALARAIGAALDHQFARPRLALALERLEAGLDIAPGAEALSARLAAALLPTVRALCPGAETAEARDLVTLARALANDAALREGAPEDAARTLADLSGRLHAAIFGYIEARGRQLTPQSP